MILRLVPIASVLLACCLGGCTLTAEVGEQCLRLSEIAFDNYDGEAEWPDISPDQEKALKDGGVVDAPDWIELCNEATVELEPSWYALTDNHWNEPGNPGYQDHAPKPWPLPAEFYPPLAPDECITVVAEPGFDGCAPFDLQREGFYVELRPAAPDEETECGESVEWKSLPDLLPGSSIVRHGDDWVTDPSPTPGVPNPW